MPFKVKHLFKAPAKVLNAVGETGLWGQRGENFRIAGIRIGSDLAPIMQAGTVAAIAVIGGPLAGAVAAPIVTGLSGGDEKQVMTSAAVAAATAGINSVAGSITSSVPQQIAIQAAGAVGVAAATGGNPVIAAVGSLGGNLRNCAGGVVVQHLAQAGTGALVACIKKENMVNGALRTLALNIVVGQIQRVLSQPPRSEAERQQRLEQDRKEIVDKICDNTNKQYNEAMNRWGDKLNGDLGKCTTAPEREAVWNWYDIQCKEEAGKVWGTQNEHIEAATKYLKELYGKVSISSGPSETPPSAPSTTDSWDQPHFVQSDGSVCTYREMLRATAVDNASEVFPIFGLVNITPLVRPECTLSNVQSRLDTQGQPIPEPTVSPTQRFIIETARDLVQVGMEGYVASRTGH